MSEAPKGASLKGDVALVTGASRGIGAAIARRLARDRIAVIVNYARNRDEADKVVGAIADEGGTAVAAQADIGDPAGMAALFAAGETAFGGVDILVNNAGIMTLAPIAETDDPWRYYRAADAFVCTSHMETFSRAVLEAEAFGLPVVSTPCDGLGEQVFWGQNALQFPFGDANTLADRLEAILSDDGLRSRLGVLASDRAKAFSWRDSAERVWQLHADL